MDSAADSTTSITETPIKTLAVEKVQEKIPSNKPGGKKSPAQLELLALAREKALKIRIENSRQRQLEKDIADAEKFQKRLAVQKKHKEIFEQKVSEPEPEREPEPLPKPVKKKRQDSHEREREPEPESDEESEYTYIRVKKSTLKNVVKPQREIIREESPPPQRAPPPPRPRPNSLFSAF